MFADSKEFNQETDRVILYGTGAQFCDTKIHLEKPDSPLNLVTTLKIEEYRNSNGTLNLSPFTALKTITITSTTRDKVELSGLSANLENLTILSRRPMGLTHLVSQLKQINKLKTLRLPPCYDITDLSFLSNSSASLQVVDIQNWSKLTDAATLGSCLNLKILNLRSCLLLADLSFVKNLQQLTQLDLGTCLGLKQTNLESLNKLEKLTQLSLYKWFSLKNLNGLQGKQLQHLDLGENEELKDFPALAKFKNLVYLDLSDCPNLNDLTFLENLDKLEELDVSRTKVTSIDVLKNHQSLRSLRLAHCSKLLDLADVTTSMPKLTHLQLVNRAWVHFEHEQSSR